MYNLTIFSAFQNDSIPVGNCMQWLRFAYRHRLDNIVTIPNRIGIAVRIINRVSRTLDRTRGKL